MDIDSFCLNCTQLVPLMPLPDHGCASGLHLPRNLVLPQPSRLCIMITSSSLHAAPAPEGVHQRCRRAGVLADAGALLCRAEVHAGRVPGHAGHPLGGGRAAAPLQERCVSAPALGSPAGHLRARASVLN